MSIFTNCVTTDGRTGRRIHTVMIVHICGSSNHSETIYLNAKICNVKMHLTSLKAVELGSLLHVQCWRADDEILHIYNKPYIYIDTHRHLPVWLPACLSAACQPISNSEVIGHGFLGNENELNAGKSKSTELAEYKTFFNRSFSH